VLHPLVAIVGKESERVAHVLSIYLSDLQYFSLHTLGTLCQGEGLALRQESHPATRAE
jgi:hypothetical protein